MVFGDDHFAEATKLEVGREGGLCSDVIGVLKRRGSGAHRDIKDTPKDKTE